jgi:tyrosine-protein phosphatase YwqE
MALDLVKKKQVFAIASDCHNLKGRRPDLRDAYEIILEQQGADVANTLFNSNAEQVIAFNHYSASNNHL